MTKISHRAAEQFLDYPRNLVDVVVVSIAGDWLLMTREEYIATFELHTCSREEWNTHAPQPEVKEGK